MAAKWCAGGGCRWQLQGIVHIEIVKVIWCETTGKWPVIKKKKKESKRDTLVSVRRWLVLAMTQPICVILTLCWRREAVVRGCRNGDL
jgi:hypothetical protein